jgi:hypothetical protein
MLDPAPNDPKRMTCHLDHTLVARCTRPANGSIGPLWLRGARESRSGGVHPSDSSVAVASKFDPSTRLTGMVDDQRKGAATLRDPPLLVLYRNQYTRTRLTVWVSLTSPVVSFHIHARADTTAVTRRNSTLTEDLPLRTACGAPEVARHVPVSPHATSTPKNARISPPARFCVISPKI